MHPIAPAPVLVIAPVIVVVIVNVTAPGIVVVIVDVIGGASASGAHSVNLHVSNPHLLPRHHLQLRTPARATLEKTLQCDFVTAPPAARAPGDTFDLQSSALQARAARADVETKAQRLLGHAGEPANLQANDVDPRRLHALFDGGHNALDQGQLVHGGAI
jgi:hypothetical protein